MSATAAITQTVWEGSTPVILARVQGIAGTNVTQASLSTLKYHVRNSSDVEVIASTALTIASIIFDAVQTDSGWDEDATGFNFKHQLGAASLPEAAEIYTVVYQFVDTAGAIWYMDADLTTKGQPFD